MASVVGADESACRDIAQTTVLAIDYQWQRIQCNEKLVTLQCTFDYCCHEVISVG